MRTEGMQAGEDLAARGATAPRVTLNDIKANVAAVIFTTADKLIPEDMHEDGKAVAREPLSVLTLCVIVLRNGFTLLGKSAPASPENFDADKGKEFAYEDALKQAWPLMGYALRERLYFASTSGFDAVEVQAIPGDTELETLDADEVVALAIRHGYPENGHGRVDAETFLRIKREGGTYSAPETGNDTKAVGISNGPPPIDGDEELEAANDGTIKDLALAHGLEYVDRADAIGKLKKVRDSLLNHNTANNGQPNPV